MLAQSSDVHSFAMRRRAHVADPASSDIRFCKPPPSPPWTPTPKSARAPEAFRFFEGFLGSQPKGMTTDRLQQEPQGGLRKMLILMDLGFRVSVSGLGGPQDGETNLQRC